MKVVGEKGIGSILKTILELCFYTGMIIIIVLPFVLAKFNMSLGPCIWIIYTNGVVLLAITRMFIKLFDSLKNNNPFCMENVKILKTTGIISFIGSIFWLIDFLYEIFLAKSDEIITLLTLVFLCILFFGVSIALYILSELFNQATEYKKENDLTI